MSPQVTSLKFPSLAQLHLVNLGDVSDEQRSWFHELAIFHKNALFQFSEFILILLLEISVQPCLKSVCYIALLLF